MTSVWADHLSTMSLDPVEDPGGPVLILSAHPDDEVLAIGAWLAAQQGRRLVFVTATDGEASHPDSPSITPDELRSRRADELVAALRQLGINRPVIHRLRLPDGGLRASSDTLAGRLLPYVRRAGVVLAPFEEDGHTDHDVLGEVAVELGASTSTPVWRFPIWTWSWTTPEEQSWLPSLRELPTVPAGRERKVRAIGAFATQVQPLSDHPGDVSVVDDALLWHATFAPEVVIA